MYRMEKHKTLSNLIYSSLSLVLIVLKAQGNDTFEVNITIIGKAAVSKGALCLDGSPAAYHYDPGFGYGIRNWLVFLEGGAWCNTVADCRSRQKTKLGSSSKMTKQDFSGILSKTKTSNPEFYNWHKVYVRYCDGSSFMGNVEAVNPVTNIIHYRGARIFDAVVDEILAKGMKNAKNVILTGCSAGALAAILHCDGFRAKLPNATRVKCISDAGFFIHAKNFPGAKKRQDYFASVVALHGIAKMLPSSCTTRMNPGLCFFPENLVGNIKTPLFLLNSAFDTWQIKTDLAPPIANKLGWQNCTTDLKYCTNSQLQIMKAFSTAFSNTLRKIGNSSSRGMFINTCYLHCHSYGGTWNVIRTSGNKTLAKVVGDWYFDRSSFQKIDFQRNTPHNCTIAN